MSDSNVDNSESESPPVKAKKRKVLQKYRADCERIFSLVIKNKTDYRVNLSTATLGSLITCKTMMTATSKICHSTEHSQELLKKAKSATYQHYHAAAGSAPSTSLSQ